METATTTENVKSKPGRKPISALTETAKIGMVIRYIKGLGFTYESFTAAYASKKKEMDEIEKLEQQIKDKKEKLGL